MRAALREWWSTGSWPARIAVVALGGLFLVRAGYALPVPIDRHLYMLAAQALRTGHVLENPSVNTWPPTFALFALPLVWVTDLAGDLPMHYVWALLQLAALATLTWFGARALDVRATVGAVAVAWLCAWRPILTDLNNQNLSLILWAMVLVVAALAVRGRPFAAGAMLGAGAAIKLWPVFALAPLFFSQRRRWLLVFATFAAVLLAIGATWAVLGTDLLSRATHWWLVVVPAQSGGNGLGNQAWSGLFQRLFGGVPLEALSSSITVAPDTPGIRLGRILGRLLGAALVLALLVYSVARRPASPRVALLDALLFTVAMQAALPFAWTHYFAGIVPIALAVASSRDELVPTQRKWATWLIVVAILLGSFDFDLVGKPVWRVAAFYGHALLSATAVCAAGLLLRAHWQRSVFQRELENQRCRLCLSLSKDESMHRSRLTFSASSR